MAICVTVTFDGTGAESVTPASLDILLVSGAVYGELPVAVREGYVFEGWWTAPGGTAARIEEGSQLFEGVDHTLYARWAEAGGEEAGFSGFTLTADRKWAHVAPGAVAAGLPATLKSAYGGWLTEEGRLGALALITESIVYDFRSAVVAASHPSGGLAEDLVPLAVLRHVLAGIHCWLAADMDVTPIEAYRVAGEQSEIYLRRLLIDLRSGNNRFAVTGGGTPRYSGARAASTPAEGAGADGGGSGVINLGIY